MSKSKEKKEKEDEKMLSIKEQVEYYLGDENLKHDQFFHNKISEDVDGYLDLDFLLKCNKIKKAGWKKEELVEGIKLSEALELNSKNDKVRRKDNKPLPELELLSKKRQKPEKEEEKEREPVILMFESEKETESNWRDICNAFKTENPDLNVIYSRFKTNLGHIVVEPENDDDLNFKDKFEYDGVEFKVKKCEGDDLINFFKDHGKHYEDCVAMHKRRNRKGKKEPKNKNKKEKKEIKQEVKKEPMENVELKNEVTLGEQKFKDIASIKNKTRKIITDTKDGEKLKEKEQKIILDLLKYHHNYEEKCKDLDYITVGKPENYDTSRCFIIVNKKKEKNDFSVQKCIDDLVKKINEE